MNNLIKIFITILILSVCYFGLTSFKKLNEKTKIGTFNLIYIDNSKMEGTAGLSSNMIEYINTQADSVKKNNFL